MIDIHHIRRINLERVIASAGSAASFCNASGSNPGYISTIRSHERNMGEDLARKIESNMGIEPGWFDREHGKEGKLICIEGNTVEEVVEQIRSLDPETLGAIFAQLVARSTTTNDHS